MSGTVSTRWYFGDWFSDAGLRASSLAARGLWIDLLAIAGSNKGRDHGFVVLAGRIPSPAEIARTVGSSIQEVELLLDELSRNGVFSRDRRGAIYNRRMVRAEKNRKNGKLGGNPNLLKTKETADSFQPLPHRGSGSGNESNLFELEESQEEQARGRKKKTTLPDDFKPDREVPISLGWPSERIDRQIQEFCDSARAHNRQYADWQAAWRNWVRSPYQNQGAINGNYRNGSGASSGTGGHKSFASFAVARAREAGKAST